MTVKAPNIYFDNKLFTKSIKEYSERKKTNSKEKIPEDVGNMLIMISRKMANRYNFNRIYL